MTFERQKFLVRCKKLLCSGLPCSSCILEDYCMYGDDVPVEAYVPNIENRIAETFGVGGS